MPRSRFAFAGIVLLAGSCAVTAAAAEPEEPVLARRFDAVVQPFLKSHCLACHGTLKREGKLDLSVYSSLQAVVKNPRVWDGVLERLEAEEMPPEKAPRQLLPHERRAVIEWIADVHEHEARRNAGDPGGRYWHRRLSNAEFDFTIRDLTGVDIRPHARVPGRPRQ